jgi:hypothetical protein
MFRKPRLTLLALLLTLLVALLTLASCISRSPQSSSLSDCSAKHSTTGGTGNCRKRLLVFSKTGAFRHASIKDGKIALQKLAAEHSLGQRYRIQLVMVWWTGGCLQQPAQ